MEKIDDLNSQPKAEAEGEHVACTCPECSGFASSNPEKDNEYWRATGKFFGYPKCCIEEFLVNASQMIRPTGVRLEAAFEGFVPCEKHSREIIAGTITHMELIKDRFCPLPFAYPRIYDSYIDVVITSVVGSMLAGIPEEFIRTAIHFMHEGAGEAAMLKCEEHYGKQNSIINSAGTSRGGAE